MYDIDYSRQLSANEGAAGDSTDVLNPGVAQIKIQKITGTILCWRAGVLFTVNKTK